MEKADFSKLGTAQDRAARCQTERVDDEPLRWDIEHVRKLLYQDGLGWNSKYIKQILRRQSIVPTHVSQ